VAIYTAHIGYRKHPPTSDGLLNTRAVRRGPWGWVVLVNSDHSSRHDRNANTPAVGTVVRIGQENTRGTQRVPKRGISGAVIHVVALNALVHQAIAAANNGLATTGKVVSKTKARPEIPPCIVGQPSGDSILASNAHPVQVERIAAQR